MSPYKFSVRWETEIEVDALDEDEAWETAYNRIPDLFGKSNGSLTVDMITDKEEDDGWGLFDTDPEDEDITIISLNDAEYL